MPSPNVSPELWQFLPAVLLGIGLAASSGLRTFLPLLGLAFAAKWEFFGVELSQNFAWLGSDTAIYALCAATVIEFLSDKIPVVDHFLDAVGTFSRPIAGALASAAVLNMSDPATAAIIGLIVGAPVAFGVHAAKAGTRGASTATTAGFGNPILSFLEDIAALGLTILALALPILVPFALILLAFLLFKIFRGARGKLRKTA